MKMPTTGQRIVLQVLIFRDEEHHVAQCLNYDIAAQGTSEADAKTAFLQTLFATIALNTQQGRQGLEGIDPAPTEFQEMYHRARMVPAPLTMAPTMPDLPDMPAIISALDADYRQLD